MLFSTIDQPAVFLWMAAAGVLTGAWYALTALLRRVLQAGFWLSLGCDLLFGTGAAVIFCGALVTGCYGRLRLYALLALVSGAALFEFGLWPPLRALLRACVRRARKIGQTLSQNRLINVIFK